MFGDDCERGSFWRSWLRKGLAVPAFALVVIGATTGGAQDARPERLAEDRPSGSSLLRSEVIEFRNRMSTSIAQNSSTEEPDAIAAGLEKAIALGERAKAEQDQIMSSRLLIHLYHTVRTNLMPHASSGERRAIESSLVDWLATAATQSDEREDLARAAHARVELGLLLEGQSRLGEARAVASRAAFDAARAPHLDSAYRAHWMLGRLHRTSEDRPRALAAYAVAVDLLESMRADLASRSKEAALDFRIEIEPVYLEYAALLIDAARETESEGEAQILLFKARRITELSREAELRDHFEDECLAGQEDQVADRIPGTVVVHPIFLSDRVEILVSRDGRISVHRSLLAAQDLRQLTTRLRRALEIRSNRRYIRSSEAVYDAMIRPIRSRLDEAPVEALVFIPGRELLGLPMSALRSPNTGRFLIQDYPVAIAPSLSLTEPRPIGTDEARVLIGALTQAVQGFPPLPWVGDEIDKLRELLPTEAFVDQSFLAMDYQEALGQRLFDIVHIASHASFEANPSDSFVLTWDGKMGLEELSRTIGRARFRAERPIELVFLSACETAVGDERALLGLAGAALRMGARSVIATLWAANDEATARLSQRFYSELALGGQSRARALQAAQLELLEDEAYRHPVDWAAYILISNWL